VGQGGKAATLQLAQGRYTDALLAYDNALQMLGHNRPKHRAVVFLL